MKRHKNTKLVLAQWEKYFRADAKADDYRIFQEHLRSLGLPEKPNMLLDGTIDSLKDLKMFFTELSHKRAYGLVATEW